MNARVGRRGQALFETAAALPMFVACVLGLIWAGREAVVAERVPSAVRFAGLVLAHADPFADASTYDIYGSLHGQTHTQPAGCPVPPALDQRSALDGRSSAGAYIPATYRSACNDGTGNHRISVTDAGFSETTFLFLNDQPSATASIGVPSALNALLGNATSTSDSSTFFRPIDVSNIMACYPEINDAVSATLDAYSDVTTPAVLTPSALALDYGTVEQTALLIDPRCLTK